MRLVTFMGFFSHADLLWGLRVLRTFVLLVVSTVGKLANLYLQKPAYSSTPQVATYPIHIGSCECCTLTISILYPIYVSIGTHECCLALQGLFRAGLNASGK